MTGSGRPTKTNVERRRRKVALFLTASAAASEEAIKRIAEKLHVSERTVRADLDVLREELEAKNVEVLPQDLLQAIRAADSFRLLKVLGQKVMLELVNGTINRELGATLIDALREQRHTLRAMRDEQGHTAIKALEVLTPQELDALRKYRESHTPAALKPGEFPPPPDATTAPDTAKPAAGAP